MKNEGLINTPKTLISASVPGLLTAFLLAAVLAAAGYYAGKSARAIPEAGPAIQVEAPEPTTRQFALLVKNDDTPPEDPQQQFHEYSKWVNDLKKDRWAGGEALHGDAYRLNGKDQPSVSASKLATQDISGYFVFEAASLEEALDIAKTCPHLQYGGTVELREIFH